MKQNRAEIDISVIIPVYGIPDDMLKACVDSLRAQAIDDIEFIFIDDRSPNPNNLSLLEMESESDERIIVKSLPENRGVSAARNIGIDMARGKYIGFVDGDDVVEPDMFSTMLLSAKENDADLVVCSTFYHQKNGSIVKCCCGDELIENESERQMAQLFMNPGLGTCDKLIRKSSIGQLRFDENTSHYEDYLFNWHLFLNVKRVKYVGRPLYHAMYREGSASRSVMSPQKFVATFRSLSGMCSVAHQLTLMGYKGLAKHLYYKIMIIGPAESNLFSGVEKFDRESKMAYDVFLKTSFNLGMKRLSPLLRLSLRFYDPCKNAGQKKISYKIVRFLSLYGYYRTSGIAFVETIKKIFHIYD